ncbi:response regulator transcription factor [Eggerthellaceae bacterium zg-1084]|uniref:response regulator transcription factor n=1 Tax=Berryella wangjianweii TaxID=2734634 RepID=UPI001554C5C9|nr:response regulator transcription factor [Berryella wangjianweii]NPD30736.1 response regulator transcription factor [Berryella wangjianweii]
MLRLLLAEDEADLARSLAVVLGHAGYEVRCAADGAEALRELDERAFDLVILDVMMPRVSGLEVLRRLRERGAAVPVLMLTARSLVDDKVEALDAGANDYMVKPFASKELLARIRVLTRNASDLAVDQASFGDVTLDRGAATLTGPLGAQALTARECQVMAVLMENPQRRVSSEGLYRRVWGIEPDAEMDAVWVNVSNLRRKLRAAGSTVRITLARGVGYHLEECDG